MAVKGYKVSEDRKKQFESGFSDDVKDSDSDTDTSAKVQYRRSESESNRYANAAKNVTNEKLKPFARRLGLGEGDISNIYFNNKDFGIEEILYQIVNKWLQQQNGCGTLDDMFAGALSDVGLHNDAKRFTQGHAMKETGEPGIGVMGSDQNRTILVPPTDEHLSPFRETFSQSSNGHTPLRPASEKNTKTDKRDYLAFLPTQFYILVFCITVLLAIVIHFMVENAVMDVSTLLLILAIVLTATVLIMYLRLHGDGEDIPVEIRRPSTFFTGTEHEKCLKDIRQNYKDYVKGKPNEEVLVEILYGFGGCGKTEILSSYVWKNWKLYKGGVFILNGQYGSFLDFGFKKMLEKMKVELSDGEKNPSNIIWTALNRLSQRKDWLMVIDDADDTDLVQQILTMNTKLHYGHILITSRVKVGWNVLQNTIMTHVQHFTVEDSAIYLVRQRHSHPRKPMSLKDAKKELAFIKSKNEEEYDAIMSLGGENGLHGLPLALKQVSTYVRENKGNFRNYNRLYKKCRTSVLQHQETDPLIGWLKFYGLSPKYASRLRGVVQNNLLQLERLDDEQLVDEPINFSPDCLEKFKSAILITKPDKFVQMANICGESMATTWRINYDSITSNKATKEFLHLCSCLSSRIHIALLVDGAKYLKPGNLRDSIIPVKESGRFNSRDLGHNNILELIDSLRFSFATRVVGEPDDSDHNRSLARYGEFTVHHLLQEVVFLHFANRDDKIRSLNNAMNILEGLFPRLEEQEELSIIAVRDRHSIIAFHTLALAQHLRSLTESDIKYLSNTNVLLTSVSTYLCRLGRSKDAKSLCKVMVQLSRWRKPICKDDLAKELCLLGEVNFNLSLKERTAKADSLKEKAVKCFRESIALFEENKGNGDIDVLVAMQWLGKVLQNTNKLMSDETKRSEVEDLLKDTLRKKMDIFKTTEDNDHYTIYHALHQLGRFYQDVGNYEAAEENLENALAMITRYWKRKYGTADVKDVAIGKTNLARNYILKSSLESKKITELLTDALQIKEKRLAETDSSYQLGLYYLAAYYRTDHNNVESKKFLDRIRFEHYRQRYGDTKDEQDMSKVFPAEIIWF